MSETVSEPSLEEALVAWASKRPPWQQHVLHAFANGTEVDGIDYEKLAGQLVAGQAFKTKLSLADLPNTTKTDKTVRLIGIKEVKGVNRLAPGQHLDFPPDGLTVVLYPFTSAVA